VHRAASCRKPELAQAFAADILQLLSCPQPKEVLWHLLQIAPRIRVKVPELSARARKLARLLDRPDPSPGRTAAWPGPAARLKRQPT
jgi:hypothetical protein